jgi:hypothetical protein
MYGGVPGTSPFRFSGQKPTCGGAAIPPLPPLLHDAVELKYRVHSATSYKKGFKPGYVPLHNYEVFELR